MPWLLLPRVRGRLLLLVSKETVAQARGRLQLRVLLSEAFDHRRQAYCVQPSRTHVIELWFRFWRHSCRKINLEPSTHYLLFISRLDVR